MPDNYYSEICANVRVTDDISFKLLGLVPLVSGSGILVILFQGEALWSPAIFLIALIGALVTFGLFRWELRNIQTCSWLRQRAADIEGQTALVKDHGIGQYLKRESAPAILRVEVGKTEAEKLIYSVTVFAWLVLPGMVWLAAVQKSADNLPTPSSYWTTVYIVIASVIGLLTVLSIRAQTETGKGPTDH